MKIRTSAVLALPFLAGACAASGFEPPLPTLPSPAHVSPAPAVQVVEAPPDTLPGLPPEDPIKAAAMAAAAGTVKPRRDWFKGMSYQPPYHPNHAYLVYIPEGGKTSFQFGKREFPRDGTCQDGGHLLSTSWTQTGDGATESWVFEVKAKIRPDKPQSCTITTSRGVYFVVVQVTASTHTMAVRWTDPYTFLAPASATAQAAPVCRGSDGNYRITGDLGAFGLTSGSISNDGAQTCIRFPPNAAFDLPAAWLVEGDGERPASPQTINGAYLIDGVPPVVELRTDTATLRIERLERKAP